MKKIMVLLTALCLLITLTSCGQENAKPSPEPEERGFFDFFKEESVSTFADNFDSDKPVSVSYTFNGEASGEPVTSTDPNEITAVFEALKEIIVAEKADMISADNEHIFMFALQNGSSVSFRFNGHNLEYDGAVYTIKNDSTLWGLISQIFE